MGSVDCDTCMNKLAGCPIPACLTAEKIECGNYKPINLNEIITFDQLRMIFDAINEDLVKYNVKYDLRIEGSKIDIVTVDLTKEPKND